MSPTDAPRVGIVVYGDLDERSGGFRYDRRLADHLVDHGWAVDEISLPERSYRRSLLTNLSSGVVNRFDRCDVVVEDAYCGPSLFLANRRVDAPVVALVHYLRSAVVDGAVRGRVVRAVERESLRTADAYVFNSTVTRASVADLCGFNLGGGDDLRDTDRAGDGASNGDRAGDGASDGDRAGDGASDGDAPPSVVASPAGDRLGTAPPLSGERLTRDPFRVVAVGTVTPRKGIDTLVEGLSRVDADWRLRVVGDTTADPDHVTAIRELAARLGVVDRVRFTGRVSDDALRGELRSAHVLAVPSRYEPFGIVYLEGMAFGLPAIASANGGASDFVDGDNGALVPPDDPAAVADAITPLARDRDRLGRASRAAHGTFRSHPTWDETCSRVRRFLAEVVGEGAQSADGGSR